jgi:phospholipid/cholesterol/gamma-HCH transport system ATP-binding protein
MIKGIEERRIILSLDGTTIPVEPVVSGAAINVNIKLQGGELAMIRIENRQQGATLADACAGLIRPQGGAVQFLGKDWSVLPPDIANALRGRIGRVFSKGGWMSHLTLLENILLSQLHHTRRPVEDLRDEACRLARRYNLPGVPVGRPNDVLQIDLRPAACVRAFIGRPSLILLEDPTSGGFSEMIPSLINTIRDSLNRGAAVIWLTVENTIWRDQSIPATHRYRFAGGKLMEVAP